MNGFYDFNGFNDWNDLNRRQVSIANFGLRPPGIARLKPRRTGLSEQAPDGGQSLRIWARS